LLTNFVFICCALICCCSLKDRGPGRNLTSGAMSNKEVDDELELKLDNGYRIGNSVPTEMSVSLSESNSELNS